jgi:phenylacetate-CoA ligase
MMFNKNILKYMVNTSLKRLLGLPYSRYVTRAWQLGVGEYSQIQQDLFSRMYAHAMAHVPYYRQNRSLYPAYTGNVSPREFVKGLPVIRKDTLRDHNELFVSVKKRPWCTRHTTSGTTGTPISLYGTPFERALGHAITDNWYRRISGGSVASLIALTGFMTPGQKDELYWSAFHGRHIFLNIYALKPSNAASIVSLINKQPGGMFFGYASALHELAVVVRGRLGANKNHFVAVSTSEILTTEHRYTIESNLCRKIFDQYGSQEGSHLVLECQAGQMHIHPYLGMIEVLDDQNAPCNSGEIGRVVVTGFKHAMPLIRYEIGDSVLAVDEKCSCGLSWPILGPIAGRSEDLVITVDGRRIGYLNFHATKNLKGIAESQLIQDGYTAFRFNMVLQPGFETHDDQVVLNETLIKAQLQKRLGYDIDLEFTYLEHIPREGGRNKFKAVVVNFAGGKRPNP